MPRTISTPSTKTSKPQKVSPPAPLLTSASPQGEQDLSTTTLISLQQTIGNQAVQRLIQSRQASNPQPVRSGTGPAIQREELETETKYRDGDTLLAGTLDELERYTLEQGDWYSGPMTEEQRAQIRAVLRFAREHELVSACGDIQVEALLAECFQVSGLTVEPNARAKWLITYSQAASYPFTPFQINPTNQIKRALLLGFDLRALMRKIPPFVLKKVLTGPIFEEVVDNSIARDIADYFETCNPIFQTVNDVASYSLLKVLDKVDPASFKGKIPHLRNFHRFHKEVLEKLELNWAGPSGKPLLLVLHASIDDNGIWHRHPGLKEIFERDDVHALMIEGVTSIPEATELIAPIAKTYGTNQKIDQVVIIGHGGSRSIQLAGDYTENKGELQQINRPLRLPDPLGEDDMTEPQQTDEFFDQLLAFMDEEPGFLTWDKEKERKKFQPHRRILFNACLTNSTQPTPYLKLNKETPRKSARLLLDKYASLTRHVQNKAKKQNKVVTTVGANSSIKKVRLIDPMTGNLDLINSPEIAKSYYNTDNEKAEELSDLYLTSPKLDYVEFGKEPQGAIEALFECWASEEDHDRCKKAMIRRVKRNQGNNSWYETIIRVFYKQILNNYGYEDHVAIRFFSYMASSLVLIRSRSHAPRAVATMMGNGWSGRDLDLRSSCDDLFIELMTTPDWTTFPCVPLTIYQIWMVHNPGIVFQFLKFLEGFTCRALALDRAIDFAHLQKYNLLPMLLQDPSPSAFLIALTGLMEPDKGQKSLCEAFLNQYTDPPNTGTVFHDKVQPDVQALLKGHSSERSVLREMGRRFERAPVNRDVNSNVHVVGGKEKTNTVYMDSITKRGKISAPSAKLYPTPSDEVGELADPLPQDTPVEIAGQKRDWYAIEYDPLGTGHPVTAFVRQLDVEVIS